MTTALEGSDSQGQQGEVQRTRHSILCAVNREPIVRIAEKGLCDYGGASLLKVLLLHWTPVQQARMVLVHPNRFA